MRARELYEAPKQTHTTYGANDEVPDPGTRSREFYLNGKKLPNHYANGKTPDKFHKAGVTLQHGTSPKNIASILKRGVIPKHAGHTANGQMEIAKMYQRAGQPVPDELFDEEKMSYWEEPSKQFWSTKSLIKIQFTTNAKDVLGRSHNANGEWCVFNKVTPDRLTFFDQDGNQLDPSELLKEEGRIVPGVNTTCDVQPGEIKRQADKFQLATDGTEGSAQTVWQSVKKRDSK